MFYFDMVYSINVCISNTLWTDECHSNIYLFTTHTLLPVTRKHFSKISSSNWYLFGTRQWCLYIRIKYLTLQKCVIRFWKLKHNKRASTQFRILKRNERHDVTWHDLFMSNKCNRRIEPEKDIVVRGVPKKYIFKQCTKS